MEEDNKRKKDKKRIDKSFLNNAIAKLTVFSTTFWNEAKMMCDAFRNNPMTTATVIIAVTGIVFSAYQAMETRRYNRLSVKPYISFTDNINHTKAECSYDMANDGVGPAVINKFEIYFNGELKTDDACGWKAAFKDAGLAEVYPMLTCYCPPPPPGVHYLKRSEVVHLFILNKEYITPERQANIAKFLDKLDIRIKYESLYGERFQANLKILISK